MADVPNAPGVPTLPSYSAAPVSLLTGDSVLESVFQTLAWGIYYQGIPVIIPASIAASLIVNVANNFLATFSTVASLLGLPNLLPVVASTIEFDFDQDWTIADYPQELGAFQSYDKVQLPFECRVRLASGGPPAQRQAFLNSILAIAGGSPLGAASLLSSISSQLTGAAGLGSIASSLTSGILSGALAPPLFDLVTPEGTFSSCSVRRLSFSRRSYQGATLIAADLTFIQIRQTSTASFANTLVPGAAGQVGGGTVQPQATSSLSAVY
jgi:hypothetical protein